MAKPERRASLPPPSDGGGTALVGPIGRPSSAIVPSPSGVVAEVAKEAGRTNEARPLSRPGSEGTGPVDPAIDFTRSDR